MLVDPQVSGRVSMQLKQVTIEEVLDAARDLYGYDYRRISTGFMILPATIQTRVFHLNYLDLAAFRRVQHAHQFRPGDAESR